LRWLSDLPTCPRFLHFFVTMARRSIPKPTPAHGSKTSQFASNVVFSKGQREVAVCINQPGRHSPTMQIHDAGILSNQLATRLLDVAAMIPPKLAATAPKILSCESIDMVLPFKKTKSACLVLITIDPATRGHVIYLSFRACSDLLISRARTNC
jgi:hypothetical protein